MTTTTARTHSALTEALGLWRGSAWADMLDDPSLGADAQRLEELRLSALESRIEAELALDGGTELVAELEQLVTQTSAARAAASSADAGAVPRRPSDRRVGGVSDRPATVARRARPRARQSELHELQQRILQHDPALGAPRWFPAMSGPGSRRRLARCRAARACGCRDRGVPARRGRGEPSARNPCWCERNRRPSTRRRIGS